ncbi:MAG: VOC family protein [Armatimonadota bacterium]
MARVVHFEIHVDDPERAMKFYGDTLGWQFSRYGGVGDYWLIRTGPPEQPGIDGGLMPRQCPLDGTAITAFVCTVDVENLDASVEKAVANGGEIALPKMPIPGIGWLAYVKDTESNIFGMMQMDRTAA